MKKITGKEFLHYLILFGTQAAIWVPLMDFFGGNVVPTIMVWFFISVMLDQILHEKLRLC